MPILDKMTQNNQPDDNDNNNKDDDLSFDYPRPEPVQRERPRPQLLTTRLGRGMISIGALIERIVDAFAAENTPDDRAVRAAVTRVDRLKLLVPLVEHVLAVESVSVDTDQQAQIINLAYSEIFGFGPLDPLIADEAITTITLEGRDKVSVRRGHGDLEPVDSIFEDSSHLKDVVGRLLGRGGAAFLEGTPLVEVGFRTEAGRFLSMNMAAPPITFAISADIRLHPVTAPTPADLLVRGTLDENTATLLQALFSSQYGVMVVGQPESGKTMTLSALLTHLPDPLSAVAVERTGELHLPDGMARAVAEWPQNPGDTGITFGEQVAAQVAKGYQTLILDEVRADEPHTIGSLLTEAAAPRLIWSVRGTPDTKRLQASLGMLARRADTSDGEAAVRHLFERMPFVVTLRRLDGMIQLREVGEWFYESGSEGVRYRPLVSLALGAFEWADTAPVHTLPGLPGHLWG